MKEKKSITNKSIFGEYSKDEDRVTAALLQIIRLCGVELIEELFDELGDEVEFGINTQVFEGDSRPDGKIRTNCHIYIESKIKAFGSKHDFTQLENHAKLIENGSAVLLYITPDLTRPEALDAYNGIYWTNWSVIVERLKNYKVLFNKELVSFLADQFEILVNNLVEMPETDDEAANRVIVVGGRHAESVALHYGFYACQPNRSFRKAGYMAFCYNKDISYYFKILDGPKQVPTLEGEEWVSCVSEIYSSLLSDIDRQPHTIFKLGPGIEISIKHSQPNAFARKQRYTSIEKLLKAKDTSEL